jgi:hypothetical protein
MTGMDRAGSGWLLQDLATVVRFPGADLSPADCCALRLSFRFSGLRITVQGGAKGVYVPAQRPAVHANGRRCTWMYETRNETAWTHLVSL